MYAWLIARMYVCLYTHTYVCVERLRCLSYAIKYTNTIRVMWQYVIEVSTSRHHGQILCS